MGKNTVIDWTDHTWNPWQGCRKVSAGCENCYMYREKRRFGQVPSSVIRSSSKTFKSPLKWKEQAKVFVCSWSDFFIEEADHWRDEAWEIMERTPHLTYQILTKRPENMLGRFPIGGIPENVWLGVTAENQEMAEKRIPILLNMPGRVKFVSVEPMVGPVDLMKIRCSYDVFLNSLTGEYSFPNWIFEIDKKIDWVICGGETGPGARHIEENWAFDIMKACELASVPFFMKQMTNKQPIPEYLKIRQFPRTG